MDWLLEWCLSLAQSNPHVAMAFMIIGGFRAVFKPIMSAWAAYVEWTESKDDDLKFQEFKEGRLYRFIVWLLDFTASIKVKKNAG